MKPCGVARRSFGFAKLLSSRLAWLHFGQQRYAWILCEQTLARFAKMIAAPGRALLSHNLGYSQMLPCACWFLCPQRILAQSTVCNGYALPHKNPLRTNALRNHHGDS